MTSSKLLNDIHLYRHRNDNIQSKINDLNELIKQTRCHLQLSSKHLSELFKKPREEICVGNDIKICRQNNVDSFRKIKHMRQEVTVLMSILTCNQVYISKMEKELENTDYTIDLCYCHEEREIVHNSKHLFQDDDDFVFPDGYWVI
jgi:hypothetical protein